MAVLVVQGLPSPAKVLSPGVRTCHRRGKTGAAGVRSPLLLYRHGSRAQEDCPALFVFEALLGAGWRAGRSGGKPHRPDDPPNLSKKFHRSQALRKPYLQCLIQLQFLFTSGVVEMTANAPLSYYRCLLTLANKHLIPTGLKDWKPSIDFVLAARKIRGDLVVDSVCSSSPCFYICYRFPNIL